MCHVEVIFLTFECHDKQTYAKLVLFGYKCSNFRGWHNVQYSVVTVPVICRQVEVVSFFSHF